MKKVLPVYVTLFSLLSMPSLAQPTPAHPNKPALLAWGGLALTAVGTLGALAHRFLQRPAFSSTNRPDSLGHDAVIPNPQTSFFCVQKTANVYFVMERVTATNVHKWREFAARDLSGKRSFRVISKHADKAYGYPEQDSEKQAVAAKIVAAGNIEKLQATLDLTEQASNSPRQFWLAYVYTSVKAPRGSLDLRNAAKVAKIISIVVDPATQHYVQVGLTDNISHLFTPEAITPAYISLPLQGFAAWFLQQRLPQLRYVLTAPAAQMLTHFRTELPNDIARLTQTTFWMSEQKIGIFRRPGPTTYLPMPEHGPGLGHPNICTIGKGGRGTWYTPPGRILIDTTALIEYFRQY
ncbi:MAG: hypothetical protein OXT67_10695 [Zetaproteobacteria bacterium]|nr:hypothetical protein [Zetaproteobacteria bacterium]